MTTGARIQPGRASVTEHSVSFSRRAWEDIGSPACVRVEESGDFLLDLGGEVVGVVPDGVLWISADPDGVKVGANGKRSVRASCGGHGTRIARRPFVVHHGWIIEVAP